MWGALSHGLAKCEGGRRKSGLFDRRVPLHRPPGASEWLDFAFETAAATPGGSSLESAVSIGKVVKGANASFVLIHALAYHCYTTAADNVHQLMEAGTTHSWYYSKAFRALQVQESFDFRLEPNLGWSNFQTMAPVVHAC